MKNSSRIILLPLIMSTLISWSSLASAADVGNIVLDHYSYYRAFVRISPAVYGKTASAVTPSQGVTSPSPPAEWMQSDFDDSTWYRTSGPIFHGHGWTRDRCPINVSAIFIRSKFFVGDPAIVREISFSSQFRGGMIIYLNGKEVCKKYIGSTTSDGEAIAEEYPWNAYVTEDGKGILSKGQKTPEEEKRLQLRIRNIENHALPVSSLRKGVNVLAIAVYRAPIDPDSNKLGWETKWSTLGLNSFILYARGESIQPNLVRPKGIQIWNTDPQTLLFDVDYGEPNEKLKPVRIVGCRNGVFLGQVVISSDMPIHELKISVTDLTSENLSPISSTNIFIRYPLATIAQHPGAKFRGSSREMRFDAISPAIQSTISVAQKSIPKGYSGIQPVWGSVQPLLISVRVPRNAQPGEYNGKISIHAEGMKNPVEVPVALKVASWILPNPGDFISHVGIVESPESLALYYQKPMWSEEHWNLIDKAMAILGDVGNKALFLPLIARHHFGKESMVRWIKKTDDTFDYDFTIFDRYVDTALSNGIKPHVVCLYVWEPTRAADSRVNRNPNNPEKEVSPVNVLNAATGEVSEMKSPFYPAPEAVDFWKPVLELCKERLLKRGIPENALMIGMASDRHPIASEVEVFRKAAPWATWVKQGHADVSVFSGVPVGYLAHVWGTKNISDPSVKRVYGWQQKWVRTVFPRAGSPRLLRPTTLLSDCWTIQEAMLTSGYRGFGRVGADFWPVFKGENRHYGGATIAGKYAEWGQCTISESCLDLLFPGKDAPLYTMRLECIRQGIQESEARIFIEKALTDKNLRQQLEEELAERAQNFLDERTRLLIAYSNAPEFFAGSGWQKSAETLFTLAGEVASKLGLLK